MANSPELNIESAEEAMLVDEARDHEIAYPADNEQTFAAPTTGTIGWLVAKARERVERV